MSRVDPAWRDLLDAYPIERYLDYAPGKPPRLAARHRAGYRDELEAIWGRRWGCQGIGRLPEVALVKPLATEGIMQGGVNGVSCTTMQRLREPGPGLDD